MQNLYKNILILFLSITPTICEFNLLSSREPLWSWECENEKCIPYKPSKTQEKLQSLETCNMLCSSGILWPFPTGQVRLTREAIPISTKSFQVEIVQASTNIVRQHLSDAFQLFIQDIGKMEGKSRGLNNASNVLIRFTVNDDGHPGMRLDTNESYHLSIDLVDSSSMTLMAEIVASSFCGARHALETLSQLVWFDHYTDTLFILQEATISDKPTFGYRSLMIDTARNYIPFSELLHMVDAMSYSKLNTLHWHASDSQSFSIELNSVPELVRSGSNGASDFYTSGQVKVLVHRARLRGIRVIIEVDTPAHVGESWNWNSNNKREELVHCIDSDPWNLYCENPPCGQLNPLNPNVFEVLQNIYYDIIQLTEVDDIFHLGGDDISESCWAFDIDGSDPTVLWLEFTRSALQRLEFVNGKLPNLTLFWASPLCKHIKRDLKDLTHHIGFQLRNATWAKGNAGCLRTVLSHEDAWNLNNGQGAWYEGQSKEVFNSWQRFYEHRPWVKSGRDNVEGGEATLWSWTVNEGGLDGCVWPRAAALAERLWSDRAEGATRTVHARLDMHRKRLTIRGVQCAPIWSYWCTQNPFTCS